MHWALPSLELNADLKKSQYQPVSAWRALPCWNLELNLATWNLKAARLMHKAVKKEVSGESRSVLGTSWNG